MVVLTSAESKMYECRVLYIGSAPPVDTLKGVEALQEPLRHRYPTDLDQVEGIDATIRVLPTALEITYHASGQKVLFPLDRLTICAGVRAVTVIDGSTGDQVRRFVPVNTVEQDSRHPAIFAAIIRRNKGRQIAECHAFICNNTRDALHLVNATATANMALKKQRGYQINDTNGYDGNVAVVHAEVYNDYGHTNGTTIHETKTYNNNQSNGEVYISTNASRMDGQHYKAETPRVEAEEPETIYITFDKSNLTPTGQDRMELRSSTTYTRPTTTYTRPSNTYTRSYIQEAPPSPRPVRYSVYPTGPPAPPPPPPMMFARPMQPVLVRPPPQRMYARRVISPPPPMRFVAPAPVYVRSRARSASPIRYASSEVKYKKDQYMPKWSGKPASDSGFRRSRKDQFDRYGPRPMAGPPMGPAYMYPNAYGYPNFPGFYDRPTTKSNPRYSSSSSSDDDDRRRRR